MAKLVQSVLEFEKDSEFETIGEFEKTHYSLSALLDELKFRLEKDIRDHSITPDINKIYTNMLRDCNKWSEVETQIFKE